VRGAFLWHIADSLRWNLALDFEDTDAMNITHKKVGGDRVSLTGLTKNGTPVAGFFTGPKRNFGLGNEVEGFNVTSNFEWDTGIGTVSFITGWRDLSQEFLIDFLDGNAADRADDGEAPPPYGGYSIANDSDHEQFTQEIKLAGNAGE